MIGYMFCMHLTVRAFKKGLGMVLIGCRRRYLSLASVCNHGRCSD